MFSTSNMGKDGTMSLDCYSVTADQLTGSAAKIPVLAMEDKGEVHYEMALRMLMQVEENNRQNRNTVFIRPVGPIAQYRIFARWVNTRGIDLKNTWIINMDEYLTDDGEWLASDNPMSFHACMNRELYSRLDPKLTVPEDHRIFPDPHDPGAVGRLIREVGGVDMVTGGIALNGHIAFNEPEPGLSVEEFKQLPTRIVKLSMETKVKDAILSRGGAVDTIPNQCITVGMKEILSARKLRFSMLLDMQRAVIRKACFGDVSASCPISLAQEHPDALIMVSKNVLEKPF